MVWTVFSADDVHRNHRDSECLVNVRKLNYACERTFSEKKIAHASLSQLFFLYVTTRGTWRVFTVVDVIRRHVVGILYFDRSSAASLSDANVTLSLVSMFVVVFITGFPLKPADKIELSVLFSFFRSAIVGDEAFFVTSALFFVSSFLFVLGFERFFISRLRAASTVSVSFLSSPASAFSFHISCRLFL